MEEDDNVLILDHHEPIPKEIADATYLIEIVLKQKFPSNFQDSLVSGVRLCKFYAVLFPLKPRPKYKSGRPEHYVSNIQSFLNACKSSIIIKDSLFTVDDLLNPSQDGLLKVARTILLLGSLAGRKLPTLQSTTSHVVSDRSSVSSAWDAVSESSGSSSSDWIRVDGISSPQQVFFNSVSKNQVLSPGDSWIQVKKKMVMILTFFCEIY